MPNVDPFIDLIIALLGLAYPILLQVISRLDEKYESHNIAELFKTEIEWKIFTYLLVASLISVLVWSLKLEPFIEIKGLNIIIENSANFLILSVSILLVISFFPFVKKVIEYYTPYSLTPYLIKKQEKSISEIKYIPALSDLLLLSIKKQQTNLSISLSNFFYKAFKKNRDKFIDKPVVYPEIYYEIVHKTIEELAILREKRNYMLERRTSGGIWLIGELQGKEISEITYGWLWKNLLLAIHYQRDDLIVIHWETFHQYYCYSLPIISSNILFSNGYHQEIINKRDAERQRFIEFHYALGGLLTYKKRYACIKRIFNHTLSQPPRYELLPESMDDIFSFYFEITDSYYDTGYTIISNKYPFPELRGINAEDETKEWIMSYMAILFLRQYATSRYNMTIQPLKFPAIPNTQGKIKKWIDGIDFFKNLVTGHLQNTELLNSLNLDFITTEWCKENQKSYPITFISSLKYTLENVYNTRYQALQISSKKVSQFNNTSREILESTIENLRQISNSTIIQDSNSDKWYVSGQIMLQDKDAFCEHPEVDHIDFDSFLAIAISNRIKNAVGETFHIKTSNSYLLDQKDLFKAIDKLSINEKYIIVNFNVNLDCFIKQLKVHGLTQNKYKGINIYSISDCQVVQNSMFILKKHNLPNITTQEIDYDIIKKYSLNKISETINLYSSIIDLNDTSKEIFDEHKFNKTDDELRKSVLVNILLTTEFKWKKNIEVIQLKVYSEFFQMGIKNKLEEIISIGK